MELTGRKRSRELPPLSPRKLSLSQPVKSLVEGEKDKGKQFQTESSERAENDSPSNKQIEHFKVKPVLPPRKTAVRTRKASGSESSSPLKYPDPKHTEIFDDNARKDSNTDLGSRITIRSSKRSGDESVSQLSDQEKASNQTLEFELTDLDEDVTVIDEAIPPNFKSIINETPPTQNKNSSKYFLEKKDSFKAVVSKPLTKRAYQSNSSDDVTVPIQTAMQLALSSYRYCKTFSFICHGLLSGISIWHMIIMYLSSHPYYGSKDFIKQYVIVSQPLQAIFLFLLFVCVVSVFDRYDFGRLNLKMIREIFTFRNGAFVILIYFSSFVLCLSLHDINDKLIISNHNSSEASNNEMQSMIDTWRILNLFQCLGCIIGWIMLSFYPNMDLFLTRLNQMIDGTYKIKKTKVQAIF